MPLNLCSHDMLPVYFVTFLLATTSTLLTNAAVAPAPVSPAIAFGTSSVVGALFQPSNVQFFGGVCDLRVIS